MSIEGRAQAAGSAPDRTRARGRDLAQQLAAPLRSFLATEAGSAGVLLAAAVVALVWANSPLSESYESLWSTELSISLGDGELSMDLRHWVNDGLMVFFFFVVGLEVRRELAMGELTDRRMAAVPAVGAIAGIAVPALVYLALNPSGEEARGWGVAMATDTAFVLGALAVVGSACPVRLRVFLLTLAIVDDIFALSVIAIFYTDDASIVPLLVAAAGIVAMLGLRRLRVWRGPAYFVLGCAVWLATVESGVHPTIAGVVIGLLVTAYPPRREEVEEAASRTRAFRQSPVPSLARSAKLSVERAVSPNERLQQLLHPWTSYAIVPLFALANAGIALDAETLERAAASTVTLGVVAGLVVGKLVGVGAATLAAARLGGGELPAGVGPSQILGGAALSGIGFTVSLFVVDLAFDDPALAEEATIGVLVASVAATLVGFAIFRGARLLGDGAGAARRLALEPPVDDARDHVRGPRDAPLELVEFSDFECPFCARATGVGAELRARFGDELRYVFRHLPLTDVHGNAELAAEAAEAAGAQGRFWEMHDRLFERQDRLELEELIGYAAELDLDVERFTHDLEDGRHSRRVRDDVASAAASGVDGTPTFFIGGRRHVGPWDAQTLAERLEAARDA